MTCIVAIRNEGEVWIGADCAGVNAAGMKLQRRSDEKVFRVGEFVIGYTTSFRMGQLLRWSFSPPTRREDVDDLEYMTTEFIDAVRKCLKAGGYARKKDEQESAGTFIVGVRGRIFTIYDDYQVAEPLLDYLAVGCGQDIALGSLFSTEGTSITQRERVMVALQAAEEFSAAVRSPFLVLGSSKEADDER